MEHIPEFLYHYTDLSSLALILKNRTFRLNSLKNMDDAEEVMTANSPYLGKYCMISSWTDLKEESIPFWGLYTKDMAGIRIRMKSNPFVKERFSFSYISEGTEFESACPKEILESNNVYLYPCTPFLRKVLYTNNSELIYPNPIEYVKKNPDGTYKLSGNFTDINKYKRDSWSFQSEWRYSLVFFPRNENGGLKLELSANADDMPFWHCDVKIADDAFENIEITTGPKMQMGDKLLLEALVEKYCPTATIVESELRIN